MTKEQLHDLKRIAEAMKNLTKALDKLFYDMELKKKEVSDE